MSSPKTIVLITGANIGIGKVTAQLIAQDSATYHVIIGSRSVEKGEAALKEIQATNPKGTISLIQLDVTDDDSIAAAAQSVDEQFGRLDVLINNAGIAGFEDADTRARFLNVFNTNVAGTAIVTETLQPLLLKSDHARIIFVSSGQGSIARKLDFNAKYSEMEAAPYRTSKAAMNMLMACFYRRLSGQGVKIHAMCPGYVHTNLGRSKEPTEGQLPAETSAETLLGMIEGKRDTELGQFVHNNQQESAYLNVYPW